MNGQPNTAFTDAIGTSPFIRSSEKTVIDKLFAREDVDRIRELQKLSRLNRDQLQELLHLLTAVEPKLLNLEPWTMYAMSQFIVGVTGFMTLAMQFCDVNDLIDKREQTGGHVSPRTKELFETGRLRVDRSMKFILSTFSYSGRVTLSNKALAFKEFTRERWELEYANKAQQGLIPHRNYFSGDEKAG
jgi:hypothetical protein